MSLSREKDILVVSAGTCLVFMAVMLCNGGSSKASVMTQYGQDDRAALRYEATFLICKNAFRTHSFSRADFSYQGLPASSVCSQKLNRCSLMKSSSWLDLFSPPIKLPILANHTRSRGYQFYMRLWFTPGKCSQTGDL
jgi:hypothetical protein